MTTRSAKPPDVCPHCGAIARPKELNFVRYLCGSTLLFQTDACTIEQRDQRISELERQVVALSSAATLARQYIRCELQDHAASRVSGTAVSVRWPPQDAAKIVLEINAALAGVKGVGGT